MTPHRKHSICAVLSTILAIAACTAPGREATRTAPAPAVALQSDSAAITRAQADSARYPYTTADIHFMSAMIGHHSQAIVMARMAPSHGASESVSILAERITNGQQDEIVTMQQWLSDRLQHLPEPGTTGMTMTMNRVGHAMQIPGMLTEAQMKQLGQASGPEFDQLFLTFMIQHHRGAIVMVNELFSAQGAGQDQSVFKIASDINADQSTEIERMEVILAHRRN